MAAPEWAAYIADLNAMLGSNLGNANLHLYPLANTNAFHDAGALGSDFAHVGLGSPDFPQLRLALSNGTLGGVSANGSAVTGAGSNQDGTAPADGKTTAEVLTVLSDDSMFPISGKSVSLRTNGGTAIITPSSVVTDSQGAAAFTVTDLNPEPVTITATDTTDGVIMTEKPVLTFVTPQAASAGIVASLNTEPADGSTADTITVTLKDSLGRATPGKLIALDQGGASSVVTASSPAVTDSNGEIQFSATDLHTENITYTATDVTDGNLPVPGSAMVDFTNGGGGCASASYVTGTANPAPGYSVSAFATGFFVSAGDQGFAYNCFGAFGMAWDAAGNMYVTDWPTGNVYKFGTSGGAADAGHLFTTVKAPATGLAIDPVGNMFASEGSVSGANGDIVPVDLSDGTVGTAIASGIPCIGSMAIDPAIPALYVDDFCSSGPVSPNVWQVTGIDDASPTTVVYAETPDNVENFNLAVAPDGAVYDVYAQASPGAPIARIAPGGSSVSPLTAADNSPITLTRGLGMTVGGKQASGDAQFLIAPFNPQASAVTGPDESVFNLDLTGASPALGASLTSTDFSGLSNFAIGPDGCLYVAGGPTVSRITNTDGTCSFGPAAQPPKINLSPAVVTPNPVQGTSQSFTATLLYGGALGGVPMTLQTTGANPLYQFATTNASGQATFNYTGAHPGDDMASALSVVSSESVVSNPALVMWDPGQDLTFLTLAESPAAASKIQQVTLSANLTDVSVNPVVPVVGQTIDFSLGDLNCMGTTDSKGDASCQVTSAILGTATLRATFAGTAQLASSNASEGFLGIGEVAGKLRISPKRLNFGNVAVGHSKTKLLKITNLGKNTKKKMNAVPITVVMQSVNNAVYQVTTQCVETLDPKAKGMKAGSCVAKVEFAPTEAMKYPATLTVIDNLEPNEMQAVPVTGAGKK